MAILRLCGAWIALGTSEMCAHKDGSVGKPRAWETYPGPREPPRAGSLAWHKAAACWMDGRKADGPGHFPVTALTRRGRARLFRQPCAAGQRLMTSALSPGPRRKATSNPAPPLMASPRMKAASRSAPIPQSPAGQKLPDYRRHSLSPTLKPLNDPLLRLDSLGRREN